MDLKGKKVVVIGGSSGIGVAVTNSLSKNGAKLIITGRSKEKLDKICSGNDNITLASAFDFTNEKAVKDFFASLDEIDDIVVVAAGSPKTGLFLNEGSLASIQDYIDQKLKGVLYTAFYGIPKLNSNGSITFFNGIPGKKPILNVQLFPL